MSRLPGISDLFRSRSQVRRRKPKRRREAERFAGRMESLESRALLAFSPLPASPDLLGGAIKLTSDNLHLNHELTIILDDQSNPTSVTATITTFDGTTTKTGQFFNFSGISYLASNDTDGSVVNSVKLWTSYEADLAGYENAPSDTSKVGLATLWQVKSHFPAGAATTSLLTMENVDRLVVTSGVIGGGASTIAGEFESPTLAASLTAATAAQVTLNSGTRVTGANIGGTTALEPIVAYTLAITTQTGDVNLATDVFTVEDLSITAAKDVTLSGLLQVTKGDITIASTSGNLALGASTFFAHALDGKVSLSSECGTVSVQKVCAADSVTVIGELGVTVGGVIDAGEGITITAENGPVTVADLLAGGAIDIDAGKTITVTGLVRASTGDISITSVSDAVNVSIAAKVHAVAGGVDIDATRGSATLQNLAAKGDISVDTLGELALRGTIQSFDGNIKVGSGGAVNVAATIQAGLDVDIKSDLQVTSFSGGLASIDVLSGGSYYEYAIVTIAPPSSGLGRAALARAVINFIPGLSYGPVGRIDVIDPGYGYAPGEQVAVTIVGSPGRSFITRTILPGPPPVVDEVTTVIPPAQGAFAVATASNAFVTITAGESLNVTALKDVTLNMRLDGREVTIEAESGTATLDQVYAIDDVRIVAAQGVTIFNEARSSTGNLVIQSSAGQVVIEDLLAKVDVAISSKDAVTLNGFIRSEEGNITVTSDDAVNLHGPVATVSGSVVISSRAGDIDFKDDITSGDGGVSLTAHNAIRQTANTGISEIEVLVSGSQTFPDAGTVPTVTVTVAPPASGSGEAALASAVVRRRDAGNLGYEYFVAEIIVTRPGVGYAIGESPVVTIDGINGAVARVVSPRGLRNLSAGTDVTVVAGADVVLINAVTATTGDIRVASVSGTVEMGGSSAILNAVAGSVTVKADTGAALVNAVYAGTDITIDVAEQVTLFGVLESDAGNVEVKSWKRDIDLTPSGARIAVDAGSATLTALNGSVLTPRVLHADGDITIRGLTTIELRNEITSDGGSITVESVSGGIDISGNINAPQNAIDLVAPGAVTQSSRGVAFVEVLSGGAGYNGSATVTVAAPAAAGGRAATARLLLGSVGGVSGVIIGISVVDPGAGYAVGEVPVVTINAGGSPGAGGAAAAIVVVGEQNLVGGTGVEITTGDKITLLNRVTATTGDVVLFGGKGVAVLGSVDAGNDASVVTGADGGVIVTRIVAGDSVTVTAGRDVELLDLVDAATGGVLVTSTAGGLVTNIINAELDITLVGEKGVKFENDIAAGGDITVTAASGLVDSAQSNKQITSRDGAIAVSARTAFLGPMRAEQAINVDAQGAIVVSAVTSQAGGFSVVSRADSISLSGAIVAESVTGSAQREFAVLAPVTARTGDVTIVANDGTVALQADVIAVKGDIDLTGRAILQGGLGVAKVVIDPVVDGEGKILGQKAGDGYSAATTKVVISAPRRGGTAAQAVPIVGEVQVNTKTKTTTDADGNTVTIEEPVKADSGIVQLILTSPGSGYEIGEPVTVTFIDPNVESEASATVTLQSVVPNAALVADSGEVRLKATTEALTVQTIKAGSSVALNANKAVTVTDLVVSGGAISLTTPTGGVTARDLLAATGITIAGFEDARLSRQVHTKTGDIDIRSTAGSVAMAANVLASEGDVVLNAHHAISQAQNGLEIIVLTFGGDDYTSPIVTVSPPRGGGTAATARAIVSTEAPGPVLAIELLTPGSGYAPGEFVTVTIEQGANQSAAAIGIASTSDPKIVAGGRIAIAAGGNVELENEVRAVTGAVSILSLGGDVELSAPNVIVHAEADAVSVSAATGLVNLGKVIAEEDIDVSSLHALTAAGTLVSEAGDISLVSKAAGVSLSSVVTADVGSIDISAFAAIESKRNGVSRIEILAAGAGYDPDATSVIFAPPGGTLVGGVATGARFGSRAAAGRVNVDQQGRVVGVQVLDPGIGYLPGEAVQVEVRGSGSGASVTAYVDRPVVALSAGSNVTLTAGDDVEVIATVRSTKAGNVSVSSLSGDVTLDADASLLQAVQGDVAITATAGRVTMPQVTAGGAFAASAKTGLVLNRTVDAGTGDISMRTLHGELRLAQSASVVAKTGDISLASEAGTVQTFAVLNAGDAISVASLGTLTLAGSVVSKAGAIELKSVASDVAFSGIVSAETNAATISAFGNVESATGGVTRIEMVNRGTGYVDVFTQVVVLRDGETVDENGVIEPDPAELNPRDGFRRAAARAVLNEDGQVIAIEIVDPGRRYLQTDDVRIVIRDTRSDDATGQGATAVAYVDPSDQTLSGLLDVDVTAGRDITLVGVVRSLQGDVTVTSTSGNIGSQDQALPLLHAIQGAVSVTAKAGEAWVVQITAGEDVDVAAKRGVVVSEAIDSTAGDIAIATTHGDLGLENASLVAKAGSVSLTSLAGEIASPLVLKAADAISVASLGRLALSGAIASTGGSINLESSAANVTFNAVVSAEQGQVSIAAFGEIESFEGGVSRTTLISGGQNYQKGFTQVIVIKNGETVDGEGNVVPDPAETNAREGFRPATVVAIVAEDGTINGLRIADPGNGYLQSDNVRIVIRDAREDGATGSGASGLAFVDPAVQTVAALGNASLRAGGDIQVIGVVRSLEGDVIVESTSGDLELGGDNVVLQAIEGSVSLTANAGSAQVQQISARNDVIVEAKTGVTLAGKIDSTLGDISLTTTHGHLELDLPGASVVAPGGGVALLSKAGRIEGPDAISASGPIAITSFDTLVANGKIASSAGAVELRSTAGDIDLNAVVEAKNDAIVIQAFGNINSRDGGVSRLQIVTEGRGYADSNTLVYVLFEDEVNLVDEETFALTSGDTANSRGESFRRAAARAILDEQGAVVAVELVDRGSGYLPTDRLITRVFDTRPDDERAGGGATLVTYVDPSAQAVSAGSDVTLKAGDDLTLIGIVRSTAGDVRVESATGNVNLAANQALLQTLAGDVSVSALAGAASIRQINAQGDVDVFASRGVEILRAVESKAGDISLRTDLGDIDLDTVITEVTESKTSTGVRLWATVGAIEITATTGKINTPQTLRAGGDITIKSLGTVELADSILSDAGDITVDSAAARVTLNAVVKAAEGSVTIRSSSDLDDIGGGLTRIDIVNGGSSYSNATTVRVSAPRNGGDAARVRPIIENGRITRLEIVYAGKGYEPGETVVLIGDDTFVDFPESDGDVRGRGAEAIAFCESPTQSIEAKDSITVETRDNLKMFGVLRAEGVGGITLRSRAGDVDLIGANRTSTVADATNGGVAVFAPSGAARVFDLLADTTVVVEAEQDITANGLIRATEGTISVVSTSGDVVVQGQGKLHAVTGSVEVLATRGDAKVQNLFAGQDITLATLGDVKLTEAVHAAAGDLTVVTKAGIDNAGTVESGGSISLTATLGVTSLGGGIVRIDLLSGGANYEYAIVTISGPASGGGRAATARATIDDAGTITAIAIVDPGYGYASGEVVNVQIEGQPVRPVPGGAPLPAGDGARAVATASQISSSLTAGDSIAIAAGTVVDLTNELRAKAGGVTIDVAAGPLKVSEVYAAQDVALTAAQTISLGGLLRTSGGDVAIESTGGSLDMQGVIRAPAGKVQIETAGEVVQRGGSISRDKIYLLSGGSGYTSALVVVDPPPGAGQAALARAVITDPNPFDDDDTGYISEIILLDPGWGYPSDSRVNVRITGGGGEGAAAVFGTEVISSTIEANGDVAITSGDDITLISTVRSMAGDVGILATLGDVSIESVTAGQTVDVTSKRGAVTLVSVSATQDANIIADQGVLVSDSLNTSTGDITIETTNGDITFAKELAVVGGVVEGPVEEIEPRAVISSKAGGIAITAHNGAIVTPYVINAGGDVSLSSLGGMDLTNQITSQGGDIRVTSTSSLVRVRTNMVAEAGSITVEAQTRLQQEFVSGISKIELLSSGEIRDEVPVVSVSVAAPRNGGEAATAYAVFERRPIDNNEDDDGNPFDNVVEYEYFIGSIAVINPGYGYDVGENPIVTITGVDGATARAYGPTMVGMITAQEDVNLLAGENIKLITKIHAVDGTVTVASKAGDIDLTADSLFLSSKAGGIDIDAYGGSVHLQRAAGFTDVTVNAMEEINVLRSAMSENGGIVIASTNNAIDVRQLNAMGDISVSGFKTSTLFGEIASVTGDVTATSTAGGLRLNANIVAGGDVSLTAQRSIQQLDPTGIEAVEVIAAGTNTQVTLTPVPPTVTVTIDPPAAGGRAATARAIVGKRFLGNDPGGTDPIWEYYIQRVEIIDAGSGYAVAESPIVTITGMPGAVARAVTRTSESAVVADDDLNVTAGGDVQLVRVFRSSTGDVTIASVSGSLDLSADTFVAHAAAGGVALTSSAGTVAVQQVTADDAVSISGARGVQIEGLVNSSTGTVTVDSTAGEAMIRTILAGDGVTVGASHDVTLLGTIAADGGDISIVSRNRDLDFTAAGAQLNALQGGVSLAAVNGTIMSPPTLHASKNVTLTSFNTLALNNEITSDTGVIDLKSTSGSINLGANLDARDDSIRIHAKGSVTQIGGGIGFVRVLNGGSGYTAAATVAIAAPSGGGIAARGVPIIGRVNGVNGVITGIRITTPGSGYGAGEQPAVTFTRNAVPPQGVTWLDASVMAVASPALGNSGLAAIDVVDGGSGYTAATTVTIAAPVGGGTAATAQAVIGTVEVNGILTDGVILDIVIVNPGSGYGAGEQPVVTITGAGTGAVARAIANIALQDIRGGKDIDIYAGTGVTLLNTIRADQGHVSITSETGNVNLAARTLLVSSFMDDIEITSRRGAIAVQRLAADGDITVKAQTGVTLLNAVNSTGDFDTGNVSIYTVNGNIAAVAPNGLISVQNGGVSLESVNGTVLVPQVFNVTGDVSLKTFGNLTINQPLTSSAGSVTLASATGAVNIAANVFADERVTLSAKTGISQTKGFIKGDELVARNSTTSAVNLTNPANDFANVSLMSLGTVSYVDANDFETGVERSPYSGTPLGVEVRGESLSLASVGANSRIRVVSGLSYRTLSIAAGTQGGNNVGYVEYVTTSGGDNPQTNAPFQGTLRDMIRYVNDNTATYLNAGNTRVSQPQMMVFDETGYLVAEVSPAAALPAFSRPVWFDGGRLEETATANRLGISGNSALLHGLSFAAATPAVTGVRPATPGSSGSRVENLAVYGFTKGSGVVLASGNNTVVDLHAGLKADGTVSGNMIGLDVRGTAAINNTIGEQVVDAETVSRFAANTLAGIVIRSGAAGTQVFGSVIGDDSGANPALANGDGIQIVNATRSQIGSANAADDDLYATRSNIIAGNLSAGVRISNAVAGTLAAANVVRNNVIRGNRTGVEISASAFAVLGGPDAGAANVITGQTLSGVVVTDSRSVQIQGNRIGIMAAYGDQPEAVAGNGADGIAISGKSQGVEIGGGNWIGGNTAHGVRIGTGVTGVMMTGNRIGGELSDGSTAGNGQDGVAITAAIGNTIGAGNVIARNGRHGVSITDARAETLLAGNRVFGSTISGNRSSGVLIGGGSRTTIGGPTVADANLIQGNEADGIRLVSTSVTNAATGHVIQRNYVGSNPAGDVNTELGNKGSGIALVGTSDVVVGDSNVVMNNRVDGIAVNGGRGVTIGSANAAVGNQIRSNARHGVSFNGAATGGRVMGNLIEGQGGDGVFVGNGARDVRIGHIVTQSAVTGAANVVRGNAGWGVRVMPGAQQIAVQGNSSFGNMQGAMSRAAGANAAAPSSVTLTSAVMRTATGGTRQLVVTGTIAGARARQQYSVDVYASSVGESAQGRRHLGRFNVTATADGLLRFNSTITATVAVDEWISVAATTLVFDPGSTSHLSAPVRAALR